jgi:hypothetical protein
VSSHDTTRHAGISIEVSSHDTTRHAGISIEVSSHDTTRHAGISIARELTAPRARVIKIGALISSKRHCARV